MEKNMENTLEIFFSIFFIINFMQFSSSQKPKFQKELLIF